MRPTQTIATLIERAERKGEAVKRVRECNIMGSMTSSREFVDQWKITFEQRLEQDGSQSRHWRLYHYGTLIAYIHNSYAGGYTLEEFYGESGSDAGAINQLCEYLHVRDRFTYGRVKGFVTC